GAVLDRGRGYPALAGPVEGGAGGPARPPRGALPPARPRRRVPGGQHPPRLRRSGMHRVQRGLRMSAWYASLYTGLFRQFGPVPTRAHDPAVAFVSGTVGMPQSTGQGLTASGAGWKAADAEAACVGEAVERWQAYPLPDDQRVEAAYDRWPLDEPAVEPERW